MDEHPRASVAITRQFYLASRKGRELSPAAKAFFTVMMEVYGDGTAGPLAAASL